MFIAYLQQKDGCDYTIGCGRKLIRLKSNTLAEATLEVKDYFYQINNRETNIDIVTIFEVITDNDMPVSQWKSKQEEYNKQQLIKEKEEKEYKKYLELKHKYEK